MISGSAKSLPETNLQAVRDYHARSKHRTDGYAPGPDGLDWDSQPSPFRHFVGTPFVSLPLSAAQFEQTDDSETTARAPAAASPESLGALMQLSFAITAWKRSGRQQWALRSNPSSGNLHPIEVYVLAVRWPALADGLYHYDSFRHGLEHRAALKDHDLPAGLHLAFTSILWREAWKYGERAFRYCQLDCGHAIGSLVHAGALLGWTVRPIPLSSAALGRMLGLERQPDFARDEPHGRERPELLFQIASAPIEANPDLVRNLDVALAEAKWHGIGSSIGPGTTTLWRDALRAACASTFSATRNRWPTAVKGNLPPLAPVAGRVGWVATILGRRSAQDFDPHAGEMPRAVFYRMLDATLPRDDLRWTVQPPTAFVHLVIFVLRVEGLPSGLYLLPRRAGANALFPPTAKPVTHFDATCPAHLDLQRLDVATASDWPTLARRFSCHQAIASDGAFCLAMMGEFEAALHEGTEASPWGYRELHHEAGLIGQVLYLEAERAGWRATGMGCFFDDAVSVLLGVRDTQLQTIYHFTVGRAKLDPRVLSVEPYLERENKH